jgi:hypothetical protein
MTHSLDRGLPNLVVEPVWERERGVARASCKGGVRSIRNMRRQRDQSHQANEHGASRHRAASRDIDDRQSYHVGYGNAGKVILAPPSEDERFEDRWPGAVLAALLTLAVISVVGLGYLLLELALSDYGAFSRP